jgi:hypothetical protein
MPKIPCRTLAKIPYGPADAVLAHAPGTDSAFDQAVTLMMTMLGIRALEDLNSMGRWGQSGASSLYATARFPFPGPSHRNLNESRGPGSGATLDSLRAAC